MIQRKLVLEFTKMNGNGNDFIVIDNRFYNFTAEELSNLALRFCPRRTGIGADGLMAFMLPDDEKHQYRMKYYNADGSLATMCGNGARCLARFARRAGVTEEKMLFESDAGLYTAMASFEEDAPVRIYVQPPQHLALNVYLQNSNFSPAHYIWTGTEHLVYFVDDVEAVPIEDWGYKLRHDDQLQPAGANVNFVQIVDPGADGKPASIKVRTFEKGVEGETLACGTGAMASSVIAKKTGLINTTVTEVTMKGGLLGVGFSVKDDGIVDLYLEGRVETVYRGTTEV